MFSNILYIVKNVWQCLGWTHVQHVLLSVASPNGWHVLKKNMRLCFGHDRFSFVWFVLIFKYIIDFSSFWHGKLGDIRPNVWQIFFFNLESSLMDHCTQVWLIVYALTQRRWFVYISYGRWGYLPQIMAPQQEVPLPSLSLTSVVTSKLQHGTSSSTLWLFQKHRVWVYRSSKSLLLISILRSVSYMFSPGSLEWIQFNSLKICKVWKALNLRNSVFL